MGCVNWQSMLLTTSCKTVLLFWCTGILQIVVVRCPGAVLMPWADKVKAIIVQFLPGEQAGVALAATLFGDAVRVHNQCVSVAVSPHSA